MKTKLNLLLLLLLCGNVWGTTTTITSLPYTFDASMMSATDTDTLILSGTKLSSATNGITLKTLYANELHDVVLNLGTDTLEFGTGGGDSNVGISIAGVSTYYPYNIKIVGGNIIHNPSDTTADLNRCLIISGHNVVIEDVNAVVRGYNGIVLRGSSAGIYSNTIKGGTFKSEVSAFTSRCNFDAVVVKFDDLRQASLIDNNADFHWVVDGLTINGGPHAGIYVDGREGGGYYGVAKVENCNIMTDARNEMYLSYDGTCHSTSNPYGIIFRNIGGNSLIYNNTITSGTTYGGNRGILVSRSDFSDASNPIIVRKNYVNVHEGPNVEYGDALPLHALRIRYDPGYIIVDSNTFIGSGDSDTGTKHTGTQVHMVRLTSGTALTNVTIKNNTINAIALDASVSNCSAILFDDVTFDNAYTLEYNNITSSGNIYKYGDFNGGSLSQRVKGDTIGFETLTLPATATYYLGYGTVDWDCSGNISTDIVYQNGTSDTDIQFSAGGTQDITIQRTLDIEVVGNNDQVVTGASVTVVNGYGETVLSGITNSSGRFSGPVSYWFTSRTQADSTNYNNFSLTVQKGSDTYVSDFVVDKDVVLPTVNLLNTAGEVDSIPPDPVNDLGCTPGSGDGNINLVWTSTGDDGSTGTGILYEIKYATSAINASNFDAIPTSVSNPPAPQIAGTSQSMTVSGLTPGTNYYIAMKIYDDGGNPSLISNAANCDASVDITTGGGDGGGDTTGTDQFVSSLLVPESGATVLSNQPILSAQNITAAGANNYYFEVATDSTFTSMETTSPAVPESNSNFTEWQVNTVLEPDQTYYWRVRVNSNPYSAVSNFSLASASLSASTEVIAYPNPVSFANGEQISFSNLPSSSVELTIQTISGETVLHKIGVLDSDTWKWNGSNATGYIVATGTYLWYLQVDGNTYSGKIVNK